MKNHHAFVIEAGSEEGIAMAQEWARKELGMQIKSNPDIVVLKYGLFSVVNARRVTDVATGAPFAGKHKVIIITADRAYHEAQNALLKIFEEPPRGTYLFLVLPILGSLIPTLRSRVQVLKASQDIRCPNSELGHRMSCIPEIAEDFLKATKEKRGMMIKKLASGKDEDERRKNREEAIAILNGVEQVAYAKIRSGEAVALLRDIVALRTHLYDRSAPVRMILEHLSLVIPRNLL